MFKKLLLLMFFLFPIFAGARDSSINMYSLSNSQKNVPKKVIKDDGEEFSISIEHFPPSEAIVNKKYPEITHVDQGHYVHVLQFHNLNRSKSYQLHVTRPVVGINDPKKISRFSGEFVFKGAEQMGREYPIFSISSRGFLPGEEVEFLVFSDDRMDVANFKLTPNPVVRNSKIDTAVVEASIRMANPTMYVISLKEFAAGEKIHMASVSGKESISDDLKFTGNMVLMHMPGTENDAGGLNRVTFERENGEKLAIILPWGNELMRHLKSEVTPLN